MNARDSYGSGRPRSFMASGAQDLAEVLTPAYHRLAERDLLRP